MPSRFRGLEETLRGYESTGVPLVAYDGNVLKPAGFSDDVGLYDLVPRLARMFDLSVAQAVDVFFIGMVLVSLASGLLGAFRLFRSWWVRAWAALLLAMVAVSCLRYGDVYVVPACVAVAVVPWYLVLLREREATARLYAFLLGAGGVLGVAHFVRAHSGTAILLFMVLTLLADRERSRKRRLVALVLVGAGFLLPAVHFNVLLARRDGYLGRSQPGYEQPLKQHPLWHSVYIGLGYLGNEHGIRYLDEVATAKVREVAPEAGYLTGEYEAALMGEVLRIARNDPGFVIRTVISKVWALALLLVLWANFGLPAAVWRPKPWSHEIAFWLAMAFSALPGVLVMPYAKYVMGFIAFAALYGVVGIGRLVDADGRRSPSLDPVP